VASVQEATRADVRARLLDRQARSVTEFDRWLDDRVRQAREWADRPDARALAQALLELDHPSPGALDAHPLQQAFRQQFLTAVARQGLQGYFIASAGGLTLGSLGSDDTGLPNLLWQEPEFVEQIRRLGGAVSPLMPSDVALQNGGVLLEGKPLTLFVGVPMLLAGVQPAAYFIVRIPPVGLLAQQGQARFGQGGVSYLVDRFGRLHADRAWLNLDLAYFGLHSEPFRGRPYLFARDPGENLLTNRGIERERAREVDRTRLPLTASARGVQQGSGLSLAPYRDHRGVEVVGSWTWDPRLNLGVVTEMPTSEAFAPVAAARQRVLIAATVVAFIAAAALLLRQHHSQRLLQAALVSAETASRAKGVFVANMSHEIRTPLNAVLGISHLLGTTPLTKAQREYLGMISTSGKALLEILNDILDYSKVEAGKLELLKAEFTLYETVDTLAAIMGVNAAPKDLELVIGIEPDVPTELVGDSHRLLQVLLNLTGNAIKFSSHGEVVLRIRLLSRTGNAARICFEVSDSGPGIPAAKQAQLFTAFTQADAGIARNFGGTGLGLAISKRLVHLMGGEIGVKSQEGQGSEFWFALPFQISPQPEPPTPGSAGALRSVLVVDDSAAAREFVAQSVQRLGWRVETATSAGAAVERVQRSAAAYELLLVNWKLPDMDGVQIGKALRSLGAAAPPLIAVMVSAVGRDQVLGSADADGIDAVISKPATPPKILDALQEARARRRPGRVPARASYVPSRGGTPLRGLRMLLVEDNFINQQVARGILEAEGALITTADHGAAALELLTWNSGDYDLVLMDIHMPVMDGFEATRRIRQDLGLQLPIVTMSAGVTQQERAACFEAGMNDFIAKPLEPLAVIQTIAKLGLKASPPAARPAPAAAPRTESDWQVEGIEIEALVAALNGNREAVARLLPKLAHECGEVLQSLDAALAAGAQPKALAILHTFKGASLNMRANEVAALAEAMERGLRARGIEAGRDGFDEFKRRVLALQASIQAWEMRHETRHETRADKLPAAQQEPHPAG
jgi:signal transduction histidine kinase/CheY-like chemotaxis protein/HPt (histidine-containing phosphotransfer) domain-containing protein